MGEIVPAVVIGFMHFLVGGFWYSPVAFGKTWMRGLGVTEADIREARINVTAALATSALASFAQVAAIAWLITLLPSLGIAGGGMLGSVLAIAFGFTPMLRDKVWADRSWSVVLIDAGYEIVAGALAGALLAGWLDGFGP